jgi:hypothetical protein
MPSVQCRAGMQDHQLVGTGVPNEGVRDSLGLGIRWFAGSAAASYAPKDGWILLGKRTSADSLTLRRRVPRFAGGTERAPGLVRRNRQIEGPRRRAPWRLPSHPNVKKGTKRLHGSDDWRMICYFAGAADTRSHAQ